MSRLREVTIAQVQLKNCFHCMYFLKGSSYRRGTTSYNDNHAASNNFDLGRKKSANDVDLVKLFMVFINWIENFLN